MSNTMKKYKRRAVLEGIVKLTDVLMRLLKLHVAFVTKNGEEFHRPVEDMKDATIDVVSSITADMMNKAFGSTEEEAIEVMKEMASIRRQLDDDIMRFQIESSFDGWDEDLPN